MIKQPCVNKSVTSTPLEVLADDDFAAAMKKEFEGSLRTFPVLDNAYKKLFLCSCPSTHPILLSKRKFSNLIWSNAYMCHQVFPKSHGLQRSSTLAATHGELFMNQDLGFHDQVSLI